VVVISSLEAAMAERWKILILDQDEDVLLRLEHVLETAGFETTVAWHTDAFYRYFTEHEYDLFIIGHRPPETDAAEVLKTIANRHTPCIVLNSHPRFPMQEEYFHALGAHAVLARWDGRVTECVRGALPASETARAC
jgi:DNA-binding NtrC family response regulator